MKPRPYVLSECSWQEVKTQKIELAVLPWGACEAHNYHMPYGTDIYEADHIAIEAGRKAWEQSAPITILPTIPFGVNTGQMDIRLDMNIYPSTQLAILKDTIEVVHNAGIKKFLIMNSHGGNNFKIMLREIGVKYPDMLLMSCDWFKALDNLSYFDEPGDHAGEMETSIIMYTHPHLVDLAKAGDGSEKRTSIQGINKGWAWAERKWSQVSDDTGIGNPIKSTAEKGKRFLEDVTDELATLYLEICQSDISNLYA